MKTIRLIDLMQLGMESMNFRESVDEKFCGTVWTLSECSLKRYFFIKMKR